MFNVEQFALNHHVLLEGGRILFRGLVCQENSHQPINLGSPAVPFKRLCLTSRADQEYTYDPDAGSLKAYEEHDAQFLLHLLLRGDCRAHLIQSL